MRFFSITRTCESFLYIKIFFYLLDISISNLVRCRLEGPIAFKPHNNNTKHRTTVAAQWYSVTTMLLPLSDTQSASDCHRVVLHNCRVIWSGLLLPTCILYHDIGRPAMCLSGYQCVSEWFVYLCGYMCPDTWQPAWSMVRSLSWHHQSTFIGLCNT